MSYWTTIAKATGSWPLQDDESSTVVQNSVGANATLVGGDTTTDRSASGPTTWLPKSILLDGSNDYIALSDDLAHSGPFTMAIWARSLGNTFDATFGRQAGGQNDAKWGWHSNSTDFFVRVKDSSSSTVFAHGLDRTGWRHLVLRRNNDSTVDIFSDGQIAVADIFGGPVSGETAFDTIGGSVVYAPSGQLFQGELAGALDFDEALTDDEISSLYLGPEPTLLTAPAWIDTPRTGYRTNYSYGDWNSSENGDLSYSTVIQSSDEGLGDWSDIEESRDVPDFVLPSDLRGKWNRVSVVAINTGGPSEAAFSEGLVVGAGLPSYACVAASATSVVSEAAVSSSSASAGMVLPGEAC